MRSVRSIFILFSVTLLAGLVFAVPGSSTGGRFTPGRRSPRSSDGNYQITVTGYYFGQGSGAITDSMVSLSVPLKADDGSTTTLQAPSLTINGTYFSGTGTVGTATAMIQGRLDAARASRLTATFKTSDHHFGRIAGTLPSDPNTDDNWDAHGPNGPGPTAAGGGAGGPGPSLR
jgi:hypothetical protein